MADGMYPLNVNLSVGSPDTVSATIGEVGPGIADTRMLFL